MIPESGSVVDINPLFKAAYIAQRVNKNKADYGEEPDGHIHVVQVMPIFIGFSVSISSGGSYAIDLRGFPVDFCYLLGFGFPDGAPLFVAVNVKPAVSVSLRVANSSPDAVSCASCGGQLKVPYPGIKHCPKCEP